MDLRVPGGWLGIMSDIADRMRRRPFMVLERGLVRVGPGIAMGVVHSIVSLSSPSPPSSSSSSCDVMDAEERVQFLRERCQLGTDGRWSSSLSLLPARSSANFSFTPSIPLCIARPAPVTTVAFSFSISRSSLFSALGPRSCGEQPWRRGRTL